jgi:predicted nucleic acid-binding protein
MGTLRIVLDSGALSAIAEEQGFARAKFAKALAGGALAAIPTIVLAETTTGNGVRDARINRVAKGCDIVDLTETIARSAAALRSRKPACGVADAIVVATADAMRGSAILTSDPDDLRALAAERNISRVTSIVR